MAKSVLDALKATGCADLSAAIEAVSANMFKIKEGHDGGWRGVLIWDDAAMMLWMELKYGIWMEKWAWKVEELLMKYGECEDFWFNSDLYSR